MCVGDGGHIDANLGPSIQSLNISPLAKLCISPLIDVNCKTEASTLVRDAMLSLIPNTKLLESRMDMSIDCRRARLRNSNEASGESCQSLYLN